MGDTLTLFQITFPHTMTFASIKLIFAYSFYFYRELKKTNNYKAKRNMASKKRHTLSLKIKVPNVKSLLALSNQMTTLGKGSFQVNYGLLLNLLHVKIDTVALTTLA
jgi:hypothetical protein